MFKTIGLWFEERLGITYLTNLAYKKEIPVHRHSWIYFTGGLVLFLFSIQVVTGILLMLYYRPSASEAYESVQFIVTEVEFGWLIRNLHTWSANLLVGLAFLHLFTTLFGKAYRKPRELTWISGVLLLCLMLGFGFSGYLLPWNELAFFATQVGTDIAGSVPIIGEAVQIFLRGGEQVTGATLTRFYGFHVAILPALTTLLVLLHLMLVQKQGMSVPPNLESEKLRNIPFIPNVLLRDVLAWFLMIAVLISLCAFLPWDLGLKADPFAPAPVGIAPEWYFLFMFETLKYIPSRVLGLDGEQVGVVFFSLAGVFLALVPFVDSFLVRRGFPRAMQVIGSVMILFIVGMTIVSLV